MVPSLSGAALAALERELNRCEWYNASLSAPTDLGVWAALLLEEERG